MSRGEGAGGSEPRAWGRADAGTASRSDRIRRNPFERNSAMSDETCPACGNPTGNVSLSAVLDELAGAAPAPSDEVSRALSMEGDAVRFLSSILRSDRELLSGLEELARLAARSIAEWDGIADPGCPTCGADVHPGRNARRKRHRDLAMTR